MYIYNKYLLLIVNKTWCIVLGAVNYLIGEQFLLHQWHYTDVSCACPTLSVVLNGEELSAGKTLDFFHPESILYGWKNIFSKTYCPTLERGSASYGTCDISLHTWIDLLIIFAALAFATWHVEGVASLRQQMKSLGEIAAHPHIWPQWQCKILLAKFSIRICSLLEGSWAGGLLPMMSVCSNIAYKGGCLVTFPLQL